MKYITTDKHPELKEGIIITERLSTEYEYWSEKGWAKFTTRTLEHDLEKGYIKEVQEPEFTKSDMIDFCTSWFNQSHSVDISISDYLDKWMAKNNWLKEKK